MTHVPFWTSVVLSFTFFGTVIANTCSIETPCDSPYQVNKPIATEREYVCEIGKAYGIKCSKIWTAPKTHYDIFKSSFKTYAPQEAPFLIPPKTHRLWLTSPSDPQEIPPEWLKFFEQSLLLYPEKFFEHHFWCNDKTLIPQTLVALQKFQRQVIVHEINEISEQFVTQNLFQKFLKDNLFSYAADLALQEIVFNQGGLFIDVAFEQRRNLEIYFKKYEALHLIWDDHELESGILGGAQGAKFLKESLSFINKIPDLMDTLAATPDPKTLQGLTAWYAWKLAWALEKEPYTALGFVYTGKDFQFHDKESLLNTDPFIKDTYYLEK